AARALNSLSSMMVRPAILNQIPEEDVVHIRLRKVDGSRRELDIPWLSFADGACLRTPSTPSTQDQAEKSDPPSEEDINKEQIDYFQNLFNNFFPRDSASATLERHRPDATPPFNPDAAFTAPTASASPSILYKVITNSFGRFGYLR